MDDQGFDRLVRTLSGWAGSRRMLAATAAGATLPLVSAVEVGAKGNAGKQKRRNKRRRDRKAKSVDPGVRFFEDLATTLKATAGDCDALAQAAEAYKQAHLAEFNELAAREQQLDAETRSAIARDNQDRITKATETLHTLMASCRFRGTSNGAICEASGGDVIELPGAEQCGAGCDCSCICPISGWTCAGTFFLCMGGSEASCCWFGACAGHICDEQCPNCCNCGVSCCGC